MGSMNLGKGERLVLMRLRSGWNQEEAAQKMKVGRFVYGAWERGEVPESTMPTVKFFQQVSKRERLLIYRKRSGMTQRRLAMEVGVSRYWLGLMEAGGAPSNMLEDYWQKQIKYKYNEHLGNPYGHATAV